MKRVVVAALLVGMTVVPSVKAEDYFQIQASRATTEALDELCTDIADIADYYGLDDDCTDTDNGYRLAFGIGLSDSFALEVGYGDIATFSAGLSGFGEYESTSFDVKGYDVAAVGRIALSDSINLLARVGLLRWDGEVSYSSSFGDDESLSESGNAKLFGAGIEFGILTLNYELLQDVGNDDIGEGDIKRASLGLKFSF